MKRLHACSLVLALAVAGCAEGATGTLRIDVRAEDTITDGLAAGSAEEDVIDGWSVTYTQFVATLGVVHVGRSATGEVRMGSETLVLDLRTLPASGFALDALDGLAAARWDVIGYATPAASASATRDASVSQSDFDEMVAGGCSFLVAGAVTEEASGRAVDFRLCIPADTRYGPCSSPDGIAGVAVVSGASTPAVITLHGDHLWFDSFPSGAEAIVQRRAAWMAACDGDGDGHVTEAELRATPAAAVFTTIEHYHLAGAPTVDGHGITNAWDFVRAQMSTLGHFDGEGECPWSPAPSGV